MYILINLYVQRGSLVIFILVNKLIFKTYIIIVAIHVYVWRVPKMYQNIQ